MKRLIILAFSILLCFGCSKRLPFEPTGPEDAMLIGRIRIEASGIKNEVNMPTLNVKREAGIGLTFHHREKDQQHHVASKSGGIFYKTRLEPGTYSLAKLEIKATSDYGYRTMWVTLNLPPFQVEAGKVVNLGALLWTVDGTSSRIRQEAPPEALRDFLASQFPESAWLSREWVDVVL